MDNDIAQLGFEVDSSELARANEELEQLPKSGAKAERATERFSRAMQGAERAAMRFYTNLEKLATRTGNFIGENLRQIALGFAAVFGVGALVQKIGAISNALDAVSKAARATNSAVADMQALATAGELAGLSADYVASASRRMNRVLGQAIQQGKGTQGVFQQLGVSASELAALPVDERFAKIADRIQELGLDASQTTAILSALGDRGGALISLLGEGGEQIRQAAGDVDRFNLAITNTQGLQIEEMNDNWTRFGYAVNGAFTQFIAFIAPSVSSLLANLANGIAFLVDNIGYLEPVIKIVGPMLLAAFAPIVIGSVISLAAAVGTNLVGAFVTLGAIIMANPLIALATLLVGVIAAVWHFRDEISKAIGVDVTQIFKDVANTIIRVLITAFETAKDIWMNFPSVMGSAAIGAANAVIEAVNGMINSSLEGIRKIGYALRMSGLPGLSQMGLGLETMAPSDIPTLTDPNADANAASAAAFQARLKEIWSTDYAGQIATGMTTLSEKTDLASDSLDNFNTVGSGTPGASKAVTDSMKAIQDQAEATQRAVDEVRDALKDAFGSALKTFVQGLREGKSFVDSLTGALDNLADKLMDMVLNNIISGFVGSLFGGGGGLGGLFGGGGVGMGLTGAATYGFTGNGFYGIPKLASGGVLNRPTMAIAGEAGPEAVLPLMRGPGGNLGVIAANDNRGATSGLQINIFNNTANDNDVTVSENSDGSLDIIIDRKMAENVTKDGSRFDNAMRAKYGLNAAVKQR